MTAKQILLTGATGFVGSQLARRLLKDSWNVSLIVRPHSSLSYLHDVVDRMSLYEYDGSSECLDRAVQSSKPDVVIHLASLYVTAHEPKDVVPLINSNVLFGTQLVQAMIDHGIYRLITTGTSWQHYEDAPYRPVNLYAATKQAFENIVHYYTDATPLRVINLKLFDTYGEEDRRPKLVKLLLETSRTQKTLLMSPGGQRIDMVYIEDVIEAYLSAISLLLESADTKFETYAVSSGNPIPLRRFVEKMEEILGKNIPVEWGARAYREREVMIPWQQGRLLPNWTPKVTLEEGIRKLYENQQLV